MRRSAVAVPPTFVCAMMAVFGGRVQPTTVKNVNETETFYYEIRPEHFNWTNGIIYTTLLCFDGGGSESPSAWRVGERARF